jgi:hypothetical protein
LCEGRLFPLSPHSSEATEQPFEFYSGNRVDEFDRQVNEEVQQENDVNPVSS